MKEIHLTVDGMTHVYKKTMRIGTCKIFPPSDDIAYAAIKRTSTNNYEILICTQYSYIVISQPTFSKSFKLIEDFYSRQSHT